MSDEAASAFQVRDNEELSRFEVDLGEAVAIAEYRLMKGKILFSHTEVPRAHEGKGVGTALIRAGLATAREKGLEVIPTCPFFASYMKRHPETHELLDSTQRRLLGV